MSYRADHMPVDKGHGGSDAVLKSAHNLPLKRTVNLALEENYIKKTV